jgi:hypothetical protein
MLTLALTAQKGSSFWLPGRAYAIMRDAAQIGRIDINGNPKRDGEAQITLRDQVFECRIHVTGKKHWTWVPARWVMYSDGNVRHAASPESAKTFLTENETAQPALWLRRAGSNWSVIERASDRKIGEIRWVRGRLVPRPAGPRISLETSVELPETFEAMLLWIAVQDEYQSDSG